MRDDTPLVPRSNALSVSEARYLLSLLEHVVHDDVCAFLDEGTLNPAQIHPSVQTLRELGGSSFYHNYFYITETDSLLQVGLVLLDWPPLVDMATAKGLGEYIRFGDNTDPVTACSAAHLVKRIHTCNKRVCWPGLPDAELQFSSIFAAIA